MLDHAKRYANTNLGIVDGQLTCCHIQHQHRSSTTLLMMLSHMRRQVLHQSFPHLQACRMTWCRHLLSVNPALLCHVHPGWLILASLHPGLMGLLLPSQKGFLVAKKVATDYLLHWHGIQYNIQWYRCVWPLRIGHMLTIIQTTVNQLASKYLVNDQPLSKQRHDALDKVVQEVRATPFWLTHWWLSVPLFRLLWRIHPCSPTKMHGQLTTLSGFTWKHVYRSAAAPAMMTIKTYSSRYLNGIAAQHHN